MGMPNRKRGVHCGEAVGRELDRCLALSDHYRVRAQDLRDRINANADKMRRLLSLSGATYACGLPDCVDCREVRHA